MDIQMDRKQTLYEMASKCYEESEAESIAEDMLIASANQIAIFAHGGI